METGILQGNLHPIFKVKTYPLDLFGVFLDGWVVECLEMAFEEGGQEGFTCRFRHTVVCLHLLYVLKVQLVTELDCGHTA